MKKNEIKVGGHYRAKVNGKMVTVRVDAIRAALSRLSGAGKEGTYYDVTNLATGRKTTFRSAAKFRVEMGQPISNIKFRSGEQEKITPVKAAALLTNPGEGIEEALERVEGEQGSPFAASGGAKSRSGTSKSHTVGAPALLTTRPSPAPIQPINPASSPVAAAAKTAAPQGLAAALKAQVTAQPVDDSPHLIVEARAGTGKTTTLVEGLRRIKGAPTSGFVPSPQQQAVFDAMELSRGKVNSICFVAFNKSIADELKTRVPAGCEAMTMHSMGFRAIRKVFPRVDAGDRGKWLVTDLIAEIVGRDIRKLRRDPKWVVAIKATEELVGLCKMNLTGCDWSEGGDKWSDALDQLASHYNVDLNGSRDRVFDLVPKVLERCKDAARNGRINFDDMIWLPVVLNLPVERYDLLLVDEAQDLNRCQQALAKRAGKRLVLCGDPKQAIYGFAGADAESMPRMARELGGQGTSHPITAVVRPDGTIERGCVTLPLTVTRRCGKAIVAEAQRIVPDFEAFETNPEGIVRTSQFDHKSPKFIDTVADGDFILCRVNAPLVSQCFRFLKAGRKANIQGRDVGRGLISTVEKLAAGEAISVVELIRRLGEWLALELAKEHAKREPSENRVTALQDRHDCLLCFCDGAAASTDVIAKINAVFTDDKQSPGIKLSSIHRAKGLEASRVFFLKPKGTGPRMDKMKEWELAQEKNLEYVAVTRAINELVYVS